MTQEKKVQSWILFLTIKMKLFTACKSDKNTDTIYDAEAINKHLETNVAFSEPYRPQFHYTPKINWMNDPNGLVYYNGQYHLFHQYNPFGNRWGFMSWAHAVNDDLVHWDHRPVAIPYGPEENEGIFSGSAVEDYNNASGFGDGSTPPIVAIYTSHYSLDNNITDQAQSLAYSIDGGETFIKSSDNLIKWEYLSDFGPVGAVEGIWECPAFFPLAVDSDSNNMRWVLHVDMNPGAIAGGSGSQFFVGDWDGTQFILDESISGENIIWGDYGTDYYAAIFWNNIPDEDGRRIMIGWMNNWMYANNIPTYPWRSEQSIPRSIHLETIEDNIKVIQRPIKELQTLRSDHVQLQNVSFGEEDNSLSDEGITGKAYEIIVELEPGSAEISGFKLRAANGEETMVGYDTLNKTVFVDRTNSGQDDFHKQFAKRNDSPARLIGGKVTLHIFVDWSSIEVFVNDGEAVITNRIFPDPESQDVILFT